MIGSSFRERVLPLASLLAISILLAIAAPEFLSQDNLLDVLRRGSAVAIAAVGMTLVIVMGEIDLSVGSVVALSGVVGALVAKAGAPVELAIAAGIGCGALAGALNGLLVTRLGISSFIVTLGTLSALRGLTLELTSGVAVGGLGESYPRIASDVAGPLSVPLLLCVAVAVLAAVLMRRTAFGRHVQAIGSNRVAAELCGIRVDRTRVVVFTMAGALAGLAGMIVSAIVISGSPTAAEGLELDVIAAVVIGGASLQGGVGTIGGSLIGAALMQVLANGSSLVGIDDFIQKIVTGGVIVAAAAFDVYRRRWRLTSNQ
ncbi:MAG: ABC transporter permease [Deltaproteobacteria bacterium]|nr:ABC transporter permease [Deltaproteobacteria bacterium]